MAERHFSYPHLKPGQVGQLFWKTHITKGVGEHLLAVELVVQIALVIAAKERQMKTGEGQAVLAAEDADSDGLIMDHRESFIGAAESGSREGQSSGQGK